MRRVVRKEFILLKLEIGTSNVEFEGTKTKNLLLHYISDFAKLPSISIVNIFFFLISCPSHLLAKFCVIVNDEVSKVKTTISHVEV